MIGERGRNERAHHVLDATACAGCVPGFPVRCGCGGLVHASAHGAGNVVTACDRCLRALGQPSRPAPRPDAPGPRF